MIGRYFRRVAAHRPAQRRLGVVWALVAGARSARCWRCIALTLADPADRRFDGFAVILVVSLAAGWCRRWSAAVAFLFFMLLTNHVLPSRRSSVGAVELSAR